MAVEIQMPKMSQTSDTVILLLWHVSVGDQVKEGDPLCEVEAVKTVMTVESKTAGTVLALYGDEEAKIKAGMVIAKLGTDAEKIESTASEKPGELEADVIEFTERQQVVIRAVELSSRDIPQITMKVSADVEGMVAHRNRVAAETDVKIRFDSYFVFAVSRAMGKYPRINTTFSNGVLIKRRKINIGVIISGKNELYIPVVEGTGVLELEEINEALEDHIWEASESKPSGQGATFSISNLGVCEVDEFHALVNPPQAGILAVGRFQKRVAVNEKGDMCVRSECALTASFDHRVVNGRIAAEFTGEIKRIIENFT